MGTYVEEGAGGGGAWPDEVGGTYGNTRVVGGGKRMGKIERGPVWVGVLVGPCG